MTQICSLCNTTIENTSLVFKKSDLEINSLIVPSKLTEKDLVCVTCFNEMLEDPKTNVKKGRINTLTDIVKSEVGKNEINIDYIFKKIDIEMNKWSLSESDKVTYLLEITDIIEDATHDKLNG
jgi:hypothetical protein